MKITIIGPGAIGTTFAYLFYKQGHDVNLLAKDENSVDSLKNGFTVEYNDAHEHITIPVSNSPHILQSSDYIFIFVKAYSTAPLMNNIAQSIPPSAQVISLQNGLDNYDTISQFILPDKLIMGTTSIGAYKKNKTTTVIAGIGNIVIGKENQENDNIIKLLTDTGADLTFADNPLQAIWEKGIINAGINPIAAISHITNGEIIRNKYTRELQKNIIQECITVAQQLGLSLSFDDLISKTRSVCEKTSCNRCSMLQNIEKEQKTEIDHINGVVINKAAQYGLDVPYNKSVYYLMKRVRWTGVLSAKGR